MPLLALLTYLSLCAVVGFFARDRALGFGGGFVASIFITPLACALLLLLTHPKR